MDLCVDHRLILLTFACQHKEQKPINNAAGTMDCSLLLARWFFTRKAAGCGWAVHTQNRVLPASAAEKRKHQDTYHGYISF